MNMKFSIFSAVVLMVGVFSISGVGQDKGNTLNLDIAKRAADAAELEAIRNNWHVVIAVVDAGGHPVLLKRMDGVQKASIEIAIRKAVTSVHYKRPTKIFQDRLATGENAILSLPDMMPYEGGIPIMLGGILLGAIGVSGAAPEQDGIIAQAGADAITER